MVLSVNLGFMDFAFIRLRNEKCMKSIYLPLGYCNFNTNCKGF